MFYSFWRPQPWRPGALTPSVPLATPLNLVGLLLLLDTKRQIFYT